MKPLSRREFTAAGIIAALGAAATGAGCSFIPGRNEVESVYGPPPSEDYAPSGNELTTVYGPPPEYAASEAYEPKDNELEDVYGPPPDDADPEKDPKN